MPHRSEKGKSSGRFSGEKKPGSNVLLSEHVFPVETETGIPVFQE